MQVKKFEARSMKDAIQMIKDQLGPEAIILAAKDIGGGYGIGGESSVEVTAAVSETTLKKKLAAEKKLNAKDLDRFKNSSARMQKEFISRVFDPQINQPAATEPRRPHNMTSMRYADILDEDQDQVPPAYDQGRPMGGVKVNGPVVNPGAHRPAAQTVYQAPQPVAARGGVEEISQSASARIKSAAQEALKAAYLIDPEKDQATQVPEAVAQNKSQPSFEKDLEINQLKHELSQLRKVIQQFQQVPQTLVGQHPGALDGLSYEVSFMFEKLIESGICEEVVVQTLQRAEATLNKSQLKKRALVDAWTVKYMMDHIDITEDPFAGRYHVFVGSPGQGKTSSLVKLASHLVICKKKKVAIVSCDSSKVAGSEQLKIYAQILNVPFARVDDKRHWATIEEKLKDVDYILVDTPGVSLRSTDQKLLLNELLPDHASRRTHLVISSLAKDRDITDSANNFKAVGFDDVIFTRLDETNQHGIIYNFIKRFNVPLHSFGIGPNIPEDIEMATRERVIDLIFKLTKFKK